MCPLSVALFERFTVCSAKMDEPIDGKASNRLRYTLSVINEWWGAGVVICPERVADLHMAQLMPLPLTVSCFSKIQIGFTILVSAHLNSPGQRAVKRVCVCFMGYISALTCYILLLLLSALRCRVVCIEGRRR